MNLGGIGCETTVSVVASTVIAAALRAVGPESLGDPLGRAYRAIVDVDPTGDRVALGRGARCGPTATRSSWPEPACEMLTYRF